MMHEPRMVEEVIVSVSTWLSSSRFQIVTD